MKNLARTLRLPLRYRWTVAGSVLCSLLVAAIWGGNIGTLYPLVEVVFEGRTFSQWIDGQIDKSEARKRDLDQAIADAEKRLATASESERRRLEAQMAEVRLQ